MCKEIPLSRGKVALIDDCDYERISRFKWSLDGNGYACRMESYYVDGKRRRRKVLLHRAVMGAPAGVQVDHRHHDLLDCRRSQLRVATQVQNRANSRPKRDGTSQYKGVHWHKRDKRWCAMIRVHGIKTHLGTFANEADAARAYDRAAYDAWGEFAYLNLPHELTICRAAIIPQKCESVR